ncbi:hypothetical protein CsSME_00044580 [Camellia sinensis var. sinensis]
MEQRRIAVVAAPSVLATVVVFETLFQCLKSSWAAEKTMKKVGRWVYCQVVKWRSMSSGFHWHHHPWRWKLWETQPPLEEMQRTDGYGYGYSDLVAVLVELSMMIFG